MTEYFEKFPHIRKFTGSELRAAIRGFGMKDKEFAAELGYGRRTVSAWINEKLSIPAPVCFCVQLKQSCELAKRTIATIEEWRESNPTVGLRAFRPNITSRARYNS